MTLSPSMAVIDWCNPVQVAITLCLWVGAVGHLPPCPKGTYLDPIAGRCQDCSSICKDAEAHKTEEQCTFYCRDYNNMFSVVNKTECVPGFYFNVGLNQCASCTILCSDQTKDSQCQEKCATEYNSKHPKRLSTGMVVLIVFIVIVLFVLAVFGLVYFFRPGSRRPWRTSNPYRRPQTAPDEFDDPHSVFSSNDDLAALEEEQKDPIGFSDLNLTIQNPIT